MTDLSESRAKIDEIDRQIVSLFEERMKISDDVAAYKRVTGKPVYDPEREESKLTVLRWLVKEPFNKKAVNELFTQIMSISRKYQYNKLPSPLQSENISFVDSFSKDGRKLSVAFFGAHGTYTERAMMDFFGNDVDSVSKPTFNDVCESVANGETDFGVLPIENSTSGSLSDIYDLFLKYDNKIVGEQVEKIDHALLGLPGATIDDITDIYTHAQPLLQCSEFLAKYPSWQNHAYGSTADSAKKILSDGDRSHAAIASERLAEELGLTVLARDIANDPTNQTRFIVLSKKREFLADSDKISLVFEIPNKSGSLYGLLSNFMYNDINMSDIESRPIKGEPFHYRFFVDLEGSLSDSGVINALTGIKAESDSMTLLGVYKKFAG